MLVWSTISLYNFTLSSLHLAHNRNSKDILDRGSNPIDWTDKLSAGSNPFGSFIDLLMRGMFVVD
jgi:hypothetical protein